LVQSEEERKAKKREYNSRPEVKAKAKEYNSRPEVKTRKAAWSKENSSIPENKLKNALYHQQPRILKQKKEYRDKPENIARKKIIDKKNRDKPENKLKRQEKLDTPENRVYEKNIRDTNRLIVLKKYSKLLSKSNIPCCNCCGENFHVHFLAIDHIAGKYEMDNDPELKKLGYTSRRQNEKLVRWIIKKNFPKGFQILCHNCNQSKGWYGICPHEKARLEKTFDSMTAQSSFEL
jgi:hypothetical protein